MKVYCRLFSLIFVLFNFTTISAQVEQIIYQSLYVNDSTKQMILDIADSYEIVPWMHDSKVMVELKVKLEGTTLTTLGLLIKENRYSLALDNNAQTSTLRSVYPNRSLLKSGHGEISETVTMRLYVPESLVVIKNTEPKSPVEQPVVAKSEKRQ
jgi:hypothetical protein